MHVLFVSVLFHFILCHVFLQNFFLYSVSFYFFCIRPPPELLPVLGPLERYMTPTLDAALLFILISHVCESRDLINIEHAYSGYSLPKRDLIHRRRVTLLMKQTLYPQATTAGFQNYFCNMKFTLNIPF